MSVFPHQPINSLTVFFISVNPCNPWTKKIGTYMNTRQTQTAQNDHAAPAKGAKKTAEVEAAQPVANLLQRSPVPGGAAPPGIRPNGRNYRFLQRTLGNRAVGRMVQAKLTIGQPHDKYEQEADQVADQVMRSPVPALPPKPT